MSAEPYAVAIDAPPWVQPAHQAHTLPDGTVISERVVRVQLAPSFVVVLHAATLEAHDRVTFAQLDRDDVATALPHWLHPEHDPVGFYASWRAAAPLVWANMAPVEVHVWPRGAVTVEWWLLHYCGGSPDVFLGDPFPGPLAFRGFAWGAESRVVLLADAVETPESFGWLLCHELAHVAFARAPFLTYAFAAERMHRQTPDDVRYDDAAHEADPEEQAANACASSLMGASYDRLWWRARVRSVRMTLTHRVPAGVPAVSLCYAGATSPDGLSPAPA